MSQPNLKKGSSVNLSKQSSKVAPDVPDCCKPDFIYGGPFIMVEKPEPFINTITPINIQLQGTFKKSFAYYSLKDRLPVILTKVIDSASRGGKAGEFVKFVAKLKNDLVTNKEYDLFTEDSTDAKKWNEWIENLDNKHYFTNIWVFTECYVYRKLREGCILSKMDTYDPFEEQKQKQFNSSIELMCIVADTLQTMLPESEKDQKKTDFCTLLKICLWANKCDLSLSMGEQVSLDGKRDSKAGPASILDPFQMIIDNKDKLLVDDTGKAFDQLYARAESITKALDGAVPETPVKSSASGTKPAPAAPPTPTTAGEGEGEDTEPKISCPAKIILPQSVNFDIVCDNAGYELFADLCFAHFLISQNIVQKIRIHLKNMPWFVSDATVKDFHYVVNGCANASYSRTVQPEPKPVAEGEEPPEPEPPRVINSDNLRQLAEQWKKYIEDGTFILMAENYWTWPHVYKDMRKYNYNLYRKLQYTVGIMFKGDLNYRKLLGEKNWNPYIGFEPTLQGFIPAPIIAVRCVKADLICGLPKGKFDQLQKLDPKWMEKGDYGVIQFCGKAEPLKISDRPCIDYGETCFGIVCPEHKDM